MLEDAVDEDEIGGGAMTGIGTLLDALEEYAFDEAAIAAVDKNVPLLVAALDTGFKFTGSWGAGIDGGGGGTLLIFGTLGALTLYVAGVSVTFLLFNKIALAPAKGSIMFSLIEIVSCPIFMGGIPSSDVRNVITFVSILRTKLTVNSNCCLLSDLSINNGCIVGNICVAMYSTPTLSAAVS